MEFVDPEDGPQPFREPPPPDDRLWRHPSELPAPATPAGRPPRKDTRSRQVWLFAGISAVGASILTAGLIAVTGAFDLRSTTVTPVVERQVVRPESTALGGPVPPVVEIADRLRPAIAQLRVHLPDQVATGSAVMFRSDGHLLTNFGVVDGAVDVQVVLSSGRQLSGRVVGTDRDTDTAVIKIDGGPFPVATLGTATDLKVGQTAIAIGSPRGLAGGPSVTVGVVSALHRQVRSRTDGPTLVDMVQTDAPISPGSSGGALLDDSGAVIGITTVAASGEGGADGLGFATPIDQARSVAEELMETGKVVHVWLGVEGSDLDGVTASQLRLDGGAMVAQVSAGSPAELAGVSAHDVIVGVDGTTVRSMGELVVALRGRAPGAWVAIDVMRDNERRTMRVQLAARPG
ncbi:MAG TPA: trypsin-like peptidase domain-containing protein [Acidimicrobiales bacterium]|nr:trypsin-like peptidase domain-containing protein [Acidimicrobiales bacterium]